MKKFVFLFILIFAPTSALATHDLVCIGSEIDVYMAVGVDQYGNGEVGFVSLTNKKTNSSNEFQSEKIKTINMKWVDSEKDFSENSMLIELHDGAKISAQGVSGKVTINSNVYHLNCNWEM